MKTNENLRLRIAFDVITADGKSLINGQYNAIELQLGVKNATGSDITAIHLWLRSIICQLNNPELTGHLMPHQKALTGGFDNIHEVLPQPLAEYQDLRTRISNLHK